VAPHRGECLLLLARGAVACAVSSLCFLFPALLSLPLALAVIVVSIRDRQHMAAGLMDPAGGPKTEFARLWGHFAALLSVPALAVVAVAAWKVVSGP
jgi:hypothetical protein